LATVSSAEDDPCLYGGSSTIAFVHQLTDNPRASARAVPIPGRSTSTVWNATPHNSRASLTSPEIILERNESASVYPARRKADDFLHCFWEFIHPVFPVIHKTSFIAKYEKLWISEATEQQDDTKSDMEEVVFSSNLNLIFALGSQFSDLIPAAQKRSAANDFYQRSRHLFLFDILDSKSISLVQMLLLNGIYLQSTPHANRCWNSIGLAIRIAQSQGLHLDYTGRRPETQIECQIRRRVWHTCVILDRYVSIASLSFNITRISLTANNNRLLAMTFGRPTMLSNSWSVPIPLLIDDEYLSVQEEGNQPPNVPSRLGLFVSSCKLFEILHEILISFYAGDPGTGDFKQTESNTVARDMIADVLRYNRSLAMFKDSIPDYLRTTGSSHIIISEQNSCVNLQQQVLYCRYTVFRDSTFCSDS
jgi:Fungal specific transcription factor domain